MRRRPFRKLRRRRRHLLSRFKRPALFRGRRRRHHRHHRRGLKNKVVTQHINSIIPFGDRTFFKARFVYTGALTVTATSAASGLYATYTDLSTWATGNTPWNALANCAVTNLDIQEAPGLPTWANQYTQYKVHGAKISFTGFNTEQDQYYLIAVSAESPPGSNNTSFNLSTANYWTQTNIFNQRWSKYKYLTTAGSTGAVRTAHQFFRTKQMIPDYVPREQQIIGLVNPSLTSQSPSYQPPNVLGSVGLGFAYTKADNSSFLTTDPALPFKVSVTLWIEFYNKTPNMQQYNQK